MGQRLLNSLTRLCNFIYHGSLNTEARDLFFAAKLISLPKKDGGIRPIAIGNVFRRLVAKVTCRSELKRVSEELKPRQLGIGISGGCESAAHAIRSLLQSLPQTPATGNRQKFVIIKLDIKNAFNLMRRDHMLKACQLRVPSVFTLVHLSYAEHSPLVASDSIIMSQSGVQQGDPLGPLLFSLGVDEIVRSIQSPLNFWYLDDATIGGPVDSVLADLQKVIPALSQIGLDVNPSKSELINVTCDQESLDTFLVSVKALLPELKLTSPNDLEILGAPISHQAMESVMAKKLDHLKLMTDRLQMIDQHAAFFLLSHCLAIPRLMYTLRSSPCFKLPETLSNFDKQIEHTIGNICNIKINTYNWSQLILPVRYGGLGVGSMNLMALPAFLSSVSAGRSLIQGILANFSEFNLDTYATDAMDRWSSKDLQLPPDQEKQRSWYNLLCEQSLEGLTASSDQRQLACIKAAAQPHSGDWLHAIPNSTTGSLLSNNCHRIAVGLRLGLTLCHPHKCRCGQLIDEFALHPLSCRMNAGRIPRHVAINDVIKRSLERAGFPCSLEPIGLDRGDGKRPDGITLFPFEQGRSMIWDATCVDTFSQSNIDSSAINPGSAAKAAEERKISKYRSLSSRFSFYPIAIETSGVFGKISLKFISHIGNLISSNTRDPHESSKLFQRLSLAIQRGNSHAIMMAGSDRPLAGLLWFVFFTHWYHLYIIELWKKTKKKKKIVPCISQRECNKTIEVRSRGNQSFSSCQYQAWLTKAEGANIFIK